MRWRTAFRIQPQRHNQKKQRKAMGLALKKRVLEDVYLRNRFFTDVSYLANAIFGTELVDQLWGLPNGELGKGQMMDPQGGCANNKVSFTVGTWVTVICGFQGANDRVFGGGISRIVPQGTDQLLMANSYKKGSFF